MIDFTMTINGRPMTPANTKSAVEKLMYEAVCKQITETLKPLTQNAEGGRLKVELKGSSLDNLSAELSGPEELVAKAKSLLGAR